MIRKYGWKSLNTYRSVSKPESSTLKSVSMFEHTVLVENGKICGNIRNDYHGGTFYSFSGIPYAKAPVGELRFKAPEPADSWDGMRDGTKEGWESPSYMIPLRMHVGKEDNCLNLNVYTKELPKGTTVLKKPVMVFIHGGSFIQGSNRAYLLGPDFLMTEDIVLVTINYRLCVLGFLSLNDPSLEVPGNAGLKDQIMALKWVKNNIHNFGGDADNVTIFGESAGSASVHYLVLSPLSKGLFNKAIMQSGSALNTWARGRRNASEIAKVMGYDTNMDEKLLLEKLRQASTKELISAQFKMEDPHCASIQRPFGPVVEYPNDNAFLTEDPEELMKSGKYNHVPMIIGYTSEEGLLLEIFRRTQSDIQVPYDLERDIPYSWIIPEKSEKAKQCARKMKAFYYKGEDIQNHKFNIHYQIFGDIILIHGIQKTISLFNNQGTVPIYIYRMSVSSSLNILKKLAKANYFRLMLIFAILSNLPVWTFLQNLFKNIHKQLSVIEDDGACHGDDLFYLFSGILTPNITSGSEEDMYIQRCVKLWTNFARYGDPTPELIKNQNLKKWMPATSVKKINNTLDITKIDNILDIGKTLEITKNKESERIYFLERLYEEFAK